MYSTLPEGSSERPIWHRSSGLLALLWSVDCLKPIRSKNETNTFCFLLLSYPIAVYQYLMEITAPKSGEWQCIDSLH